MDRESLKEAVNRLMGDITAKAETWHDRQALENLCNADDMIIGLISKLCSNIRGRFERATSVSKIGQVSYSLLSNAIYDNIDVFESIVEEMHKEEGE